MNTWVRALLCAVFTQIQLQGHLAPLMRVRLFFEVAMTMLTTDQLKRLAQQEEQLKDDRVACWQHYMQLKTSHDTDQMHTTLQACDQVRLRHEAASDLHRAHALGNQTAQAISNLTLKQAFINYHNAHVAMLECHVANPYDNSCAGARHEAFAQLIGLNNQLPKEERIATKDWRTYHNLS